MVTLYTLLVVFLKLLRIEVKVVTLAVLHFV
jgi:hypothetical protein